MEQKEKSDVNLLFKLKNKNGSWVFLFKKKKMAAGPQDCYPSWSVSSALSDCLWTKLRCRHKVVWPGAWVQSNQSELEPGNRSKPVDGAESPLVSDFSLAFSHFSRVCDSLLSFSYFFLIVCYIPLVTQLFGLQSPSWFGFYILYLFSFETYSLMWERLLFQSTTMSFIT